MARARVRSVARFSIAFAAMSPAIFASTSGAQERVALVIGNGAYVHGPRIPRLENPVNDATDIASTLSRMGFAVISGINLDKRGMENSIRQFSDKLKQDTTKVRYFTMPGTACRSKTRIFCCRLMPSSRTSINSSLT